MSDIKGVIQWKFDEADDADEPRDSRGDPGVLADASINPGIRITKFIRCNSRLHCVSGGALSCAFEFRILFSKSCSFAEWESVARSSFCGSAFCRGWQMETADKFFCSAVKWSEDEFHRWSEITSPCCHLIWSEFCCLSGEFAEKASLQKFCNLNFECFCENLTEILQNRVICDLQNQRNNSGFPECYWTSEIYWAPVNFCVRHLWPAFSSTGVYPGTAARFSSTILMIIS